MFSINLALAKETKMHKTADAPNLT